MASIFTFVDSIAATPTSRLELNDGATWRLHVEGTEFPPPPMERVIASTLVTDGGTVPASKYGLRTLTLTASVWASTADAAATQLQLLYRELNRPGNILRLQQETTNPVFFRTFRASPDAVTDLGLVDGTRKLLRMSILAEPFALGLLETPISGVTVNHDPAAGSNGNFVDVTGVKGDVETPALIQFPAGGVISGRTTHFTVRRRGTPSATPFLFQAESMTQGTNTTTQANDAAFSGAGNNWSRCTFGTATMQTRLSFGDLGTPSVDLRGTYRVFLRCRKTVSTDDINVQIKWGDSNGTITNTAVTWPDSTALRLIEFGLISIPHGINPIYDQSGVELVADDAFDFLIQAERTAGTGNFDFDYALFVPADDRYGPVGWLTAGGAAITYWLDAADNLIHARNASNEVVSAKPPAGPMGGLPMLTPNQTNRIYIIHEATSGTHTISGNDSISISYQPRYLTVRPAST